MKYYDAFGTEITAGAKIKSQVGLFNIGYVPTGFATKVPTGQIRVFTYLPATITKTNSCHTKKKYYVINPKLCVVIQE